MVDPIMTSKKTSLVSLRYYFIISDSSEAIEEKLKSSWLAINVHHSKCNNNAKEQRLNFYGSIKDKRQR